MKIKLLKGGYITKEELTKLNSLYSRRMTEQGQLTDFWELLTSKYHFHPNYTIIHNETGRIVNGYHHNNQSSQIDKRHKKT